MKKTIAIIIILTILLSAFTGCNTSRPAEVDPTKAPYASNTEINVTEEPAEAPTEEPTAAPTEAPTESPAEAPTAVPTETPAPEILSFEECAEEILRLVPYKADIGPLPEDAAENEVLYINDNGGEPTALGAQLFAVDGETKVVCDFGVTPIRGMFVYDSENHLVSRKEILLSGFRNAALAGKTFYTIDGAFDIETGRQLEVYKILQDTYVCGVQWTGSAPKMIVLSTGMVSGVYTVSYDYYELNDSNFWLKTNNICTKVEDYYGEWTKVVLSNGTEFTFDGVMYTALGTDNEGNYYFSRHHDTKFVIKVSPEGAILSKIEIPFTYDDLWEPEIRIRLSDDGTVYFATALPDEFIIWKVKM